MEMHHFPLGTLLKMFTPSKGPKGPYQNLDLEFRIYKNVPSTYKVPLLSCYWICTRRLNFATLFPLGALPLGPPGATCAIWTTFHSSPLGINHTKFDENLYTVSGDNVLFTPWAPYPNFDHTKHYDTTALEYGEEEFKFAIFPPFGAHPAPPWDLHALYEQLWVTTPY